MARIRRRWWYSRGPTGHRVKRMSYGFTVMVDGKRVRRYNAEWQDRDAAERGLAAYLLDVEETTRQPPEPEVPRGMTLGEAVERLLLEKSRHRSVAEYRRIFQHVLLPEFGTDTPLAAITASRISEHRGRRLAATSVRRKGANGQARALSAASINRPLALLRHLLRTARDEWEVLEDVPRVRLEREPQGRLRWLSEPEEVRLLDACQSSRAPWLLGIVTVAMETGMRLTEVLGLTWEQIEVGRGVIRLEHTKSGRRREVPMRPAVYNLLTAMPEPHEGRVWAVQSLRAPFERAVKDAKLDAPLTFHDLRHHFASWFIMRGGRLEVLQRILGHATLAMTMRYAHLAPDYVRAEMVRTERERSPAVMAHEWPNDVAEASVKVTNASEDTENTGAGGGS